MMPRILLMSLVFGLQVNAFAQSKAMANLSDATAGDSFSLVFYYSTLKMLIPEENMELKEVIRDIEKIKFMSLDIPFEELDPSVRSNVYEDLSAEDYEEALSMRTSDGKARIFIRGEGPNTKGIFMVMDMDDSGIVLDIKGYIPVDKLLTFNREIDSLTQNLPFVGDSDNQ